ncbi:CaiB/BaiF CoA transferase family protein [Pseudohalioglobus lutimaris]|uniref:Carnitine dehydratase n=1 Tax=Pseudohalioglobus lutimaris TaxID=1737061 RepID=A0A2N5X0S4_9GAMM|nr:CaiB/BaiF CoA-transferase family protein [Pseudohalioglobus lutimaris]PLW68099.1 carnitine dehydratase [Pseudohalioglobus lutimaris]
MGDAQRPLEGIRVIEMGQLLAGPFTGTILAYFGAEVIKVEPPGGDPIRGWRLVKNGTSLWYRSLGRNKKSVTLDLKAARGQQLAKELINTADVVVENFRPGLMEEWGMGPGDLKMDNPGLIYARISGYGQDGPYAEKPGYASVTEGFGGFRYINGQPGEPPIRTNISMGDTLSAIHAALGIALAIIQRSKPGGEGQVIDVALYESIFNLMEGIVPEYDGGGVIREPSGTTVTGIVPTNTYRCDDGKYVVIGGNGDSIFKRLMTVAGRSDMAENPELADNAGRVVHEAQIDRVIADWCAVHSSTHIIDVLEEARVPVGPIYNVEDMINDEHYKARGMFETVEVDGEPLKIPAILPKMRGTPGRTLWPGGDIGSHNEEVLQGILQLDDKALAQLRQEGVISD